MSDDDHKRKREKNNESVRKCRMNEKLKIQAAQEELVKYKKEYQDLVDKYSSLQKELGTLRSLFQSSLNPEPSASLPTTSSVAKNEEIEKSIVNNQINTNLNHTPQCSKKNTDGTNVGLELNEILKSSDFLLDLNVSNENTNLEQSNDHGAKKRKLDDL